MMERRNRHVPNSCANSLFSLIAFACSRLIRPVMPRSDNSSFNFLICCCGLSNPWNSFDQTLRVPQATTRDWRGVRILTQPSSNCNDYLETFDSFFVLAETDRRFFSFLRFRFLGCFFGHLDPEPLVRCQVVQVLVGAVPCR